MLAVQLYKIATPQLTQPTSDKQVLHFKKTLSALRQAALPYWQSGQVSQPNILDNYAEILGIKKADESSQKAFLALHNDWEDINNKDTLKRLFVALKLAPLSDKALANSEEKISIFRQQYEKLIPKTYSVELDDGMRIDLNQKSKGHFEIMASQSTHENIEPFEVKISGKIETRMSDDGKEILTQIGDKILEIEILDIEDLDKRASSLAGKWTDGTHIWYIRRKGQSLTSFTIAKQRGEVKGDEEIFRNATFVLNELKASRIYDDVRDMAPSLPAQIKEKVLNNPNAVSRIQLRLKKDDESALVRLEGNVWNLKVTYDPDSYKISNIHSPYSKPLNLTLHVVRLVLP